MRNKFPAKKGFNEIFYAKLFFQMNEEKKTIARHEKMNMKSENEAKNKIKLNIKRKLKFILKGELNEGIYIVFIEKHTIPRRKHKLAASTSSVSASAYWTSETFWNS